MRFGRQVVVRQCLCHVRNRWGWFRKLVLQRLN
jgi:hypothetical protein